MGIISMCDLAVFNANKGGPLEEKKDNNKSLFGQGH